MKRFKVMGVSFIATLGTIFAFWFSWNPAIFIACLFFFYYISIYWIFEKDVTIVGLFTVLLFPSVFLSAFSLALLVYTGSIFSSIPVSMHSLAVVLGFSLIMLVSSYALILSMNIYNVSRYKRLPLLQAAQTVTYISSFAGGYVLFSLINHFATYQWYITLPLYVLTAGFLFFINNWSLKVELGMNIFYTLLGMFITAQISLILLLFPSPSYLLPLVMTLTVYIFNGVLMHLTRRNPLRRFIFEYMFLAVVILALLLFNSQWGVAGNIIGL